METETIRKHLESRKARYIIATIGILLMILAGFWVGLEVGFSKAAFSYGFGDNYYSTFGPRDIRHGMGIIPNDMSAAHGVSGKIVSISLPTFVVADQDNVEKIVRVEDGTVMRKLRDTITSSTLMPGDFVVVIGTPNASAEVEAKFIRVLPQPASGTPAPQAQTN